MGLVSILKPAPSTNMENISRLHLWGSHGTICVNLQVANEREWVFRCHLESVRFDHCRQERKEENEIKGAVFLQRCSHKNTVLNLGAGEGTASVFKRILAGSKWQHGDGYNATGTFTEDAWRTKAQTKEKAAVVLVKSCPGHNFCLYHWEAFRQPEKTLDKQPATGQFSPLC